LWFQRAELLLKILNDCFEQAGITQAKNKARMFLAMLDGVALHYLATYDRYPLGAMKPQLIQAANDLCRKPASGNN